MIGGTGAVGHATVEALLQIPELDHLTLLVRRETGLADERVSEHVGDLRDSATYRHHLDDHDTAICTLGVGEPTKMAKDEFRRIDHDMPFAFATACREAGVEHFLLLGSVGASASSQSFFLRTKGELEEAITGLGF
ncbi:NAD(P)H-binding protein [Ahrensia sp. R2A130]|uniref:NAD(P)H-binding protein n=1 Tax=Ahrensia sp. R2A130 TaxID=744979 RepID=UPI000681746C|nr:NAD(P)H-binding protein [Ahrensia sp. R2A130]